MALVGPIRRAGDDRPTRRGLLSDEALSGCLPFRAGLRALAPNRKVRAVPFPEGCEIMYRGDCVSAATDKVVLVMEGSSCT